MSSFFTFTPKQCFQTSLIKKIFSMKHFITADTHFGHANIIKYCQRPFKDVEAMDKALIRSWNERVKPEDTVFKKNDKIEGLIF